MHVPLEYMYVVKSITILKSLEFIDIKLIMKKKCPSPKRSSTVRETRKIFVKTRVFFLYFTYFIYM